MYCPKVVHYRRSASTKVIQGEMDHIQEGLLVLKDKNYASLLAEVKEI